jgi:hypothetical protein
MKSKDFAALLETYTDVLSEAGARQSGLVLSKLGELFRASPATPVKTLCKRLESASADSGFPCAADAAASLDGLRRIAKPLAKNAALTDFDAVLRLLHRQGRASLASLAAAAASGGAAKASGKSKTSERKSSAGSKAAEPLREMQVLDYQARLEAALGDEARFDSIFYALKKDRAMRVIEIKALARAMTGIAARSKTDGLDRIWQRHQSLMTAKAKSRATGGRSAA